MHKLLILLTLIFSLGGSMASQSKKEVAVFAMGCFWCAESEFRHHDSGDPIFGVIDVVPGYMGPKADENPPVYENHEGYREAIQITYNPDLINFNELLKIFWRNVDIFDGEGQFCDKGPSYKSAIYYFNDEQKKLAEESRATTMQILGLQESDIKTDLINGGTFYPAEEYHKMYKFKNPTKYKFYRWNCGRDKRLKKIWHGE